MSFINRALNNQLSLFALQNLSTIYGGGIILAYHQIDLSIFQMQLDVLSDFEIVSLTEITQRHKKKLSTRKLLSITVDDCYRSTLPNLCNYAVAKNLPITFFAPIHFISGQHMPYTILSNVLKYLSGNIIELDAEQIDGTKKETITHLHQEYLQKIYTQKVSTYMPALEQMVQKLLDQGIASTPDFYEQDEPVDWDFIAHQSKEACLSFQSHSMTHQPVVALSDEDLEKECVQSKKFLTELTNQEILHFCYPYGGDANIGKTAQRVIAKHFDSAVTMKRGRLSNKTDSFMLPRIPLYNGDLKGRTLLKTLTS